MTKRRHKTHAPGGFNTGLAASLVNRTKAKKTSTAKSTSAKPTQVLESRTQESDMQEFLTNAELANASFEAEKGDVKLLSR